MFRAAHIFLWAALSAFMLLPLSSWADSLQSRIAALDQVLSSTDKHKLAESMALFDAITAHLKQTASSKDNPELQNTLRVQKDYQLALVTMGEIILKSKDFTSVAAQINSNEIALNAINNMQYIRFQYAEGRGFDEHHGVQVFEQMVMRNIKSGLSDGISGNQLAQSSIIRHRAAILLIGDSESLLEDKLFALKFLSDSVVAMTH